MSTNPKNAERAISCDLRKMLKSPFFLFISSVFLLAEIAITTLLVWSLIDLFRGRFFTAPQAIFLFATLAFPPYRRRNLFVRSFNYYQHRFGEMPLFPSLQGTKFTYLVALEVYDSDQPDKPRIIYTFPAKNKLEALILKSEASSLNNMAGNEITASKVSIIKVRRSNKNIYKSLSKAYLDIYRKNKYDFFFVFGEEEQAQIIAHLTAASLMRSSEEYVSVNSICQYKVGGFTSENMARNMLVIMDMQQMRDKDIIGFFYSKPSEFVPLTYELSRATKTALNENFRDEKSCILVSCI